MAEKTLNEIGIEKRKNFKGNEYSNNSDSENYSAEHENAKSHDDNQHPHGKGTPDKKYLYTKDGGGSYDKFGRIGAGEGRQSLRFNQYGKDKSYEDNHPQIDESIKGQFYTKNNF